VLRLSLPRDPGRQPADIICNECGTVVKTVPADQIADTLMELSLSQESCVATCPHCGADNVFPGFSSIQAFICKTCGEGVAAGQPGISPHAADGPGGPA
jgi:transcription initiation factor TFIIIB Brf1 subunit/transcription initiation factor TFIIB